jgi:hypothetical protein
MTKMMIIRTTGDDDDDDDVNVYGRARRLSGALLNLRPARARESAIDNDDRMTIDCMIVR